MKPGDDAPPSNRQLLLLGVAQAVGFFVGALLGRWLGLALGWDALAPEGYTGRAMGGIALVGLGGGGGVQLASRWYRRQYGDPRA